MKWRHKFWQALADQIICQVPQDDALCEFDCRRPQCDRREWENCPRRLQRAAGELMPEKKAASAVVARLTHED